MFKKLIMVFFISSTCVAMDSPRGQFLDFVDTKIAEGLETVREKIIKNSKEYGKFKSLSEAFEDNFGKCFTGTALEIPVSHMHSNTLFSAAQAVGLAFLKKGKVQKNIRDLNVALAFFKSIPRDFTQVAECETSDTCIVDFADIAKMEMEELEDREKKMRLLEALNFSDFE